jgi:hypothetical protein
MNFERDPDKAFDRAEFEQIYDQAKAEGNQLVQQMAGVLIECEKWLDRQRDVVKALCTQAQAYLTISAPLVKGTLAESSFKITSEVVKGLTEDDPGEAMIKSMNFGPGTPFTIEATHWAAMIVALSLGKTLRKDESGKEHWNYMSMCLNHPDPAVGPLSIMVQRDFADTAAKKLARLTAAINAMLELEETRERDRSLDANKQPCPCSGCEGLRKALKPVVVP